jgi:hypothetical protein
MLLCSAGRSRGARTPLTHTLRTRLGVMLERGAIPAAFAAPSREEPHVCELCCPSETVAPKLTSAALLRATQLVNSDAHCYASGPTAMTSSFTSRAFLVSRRLYAQVSAFAALALLGCSDEDVTTLVRTELPGDTGVPELPSGTPSTPSAPVEHLYATSTIVFNDDGQNTYVSLLPSLEAQSVDVRRAREFSGWSGRLGSRGQALRLRRRVPDHDALRGWRRPHAQRGR